MSSLDIRQTALKFLARREYSYAELVQKLQQKNFQIHRIYTELSLLQEEGLQSDQRFCEAFINERIRLGYGPLAIRALLKERGIGEALIDRSMSVYSKAFWEKQLHAVWLKRFDFQTTGDFKAAQAEKARQYRFLSYRGFEPAAIYALLDLLQNLRSRGKFVEKTSEKPECMSDT